MGTDITSTAELLTQLPLGVLLIVILISGYKGFWIYGAHHRERLQQEIDRREEAHAAAEKWERLALENLGLAHRAAEVASAAVSQQGGR